MRRFIALFLTVLALSGCFYTSAYAAAAYDDQVAPCFNNTAGTTLVFNINSSGRAAVGITCTGISGRTTKIVAETKIQKKFGLIWINVSDAEWTDTVYDDFMVKEHYFQLEKTGTYRAKCKMTVSGSGGANDVIESKVEDTY